MNITLGQADKLIRNAPDGPWKARWFAYEGIRVMNANDEFLDPDESVLALLSAAPDLAQTIAGMRWEYGVEQAIGTTQWFRSRPMAEAHAEVRGGFRFVRRLVGPVEVIDGE